MMQATAPAQQRVIKTPDQRLRVFVSSTLQELAEERKAVRRAIQRLRLTPVMFELGARPHAPKDLYRAYLDQSDIFVGIYYQSYGWVAPGETISGLEDEFNLSKKLPRLLYFKGPAPEMQEELQKLRDQIQQDSYRAFGAAEELEELVTTDLALLLSERFELSEQPKTAEQEIYYLPHPPHPLIGRSQEIKMVTDWLRIPEKRLVTLLGSGGVGKSRLSIEIAEQLKDDFPDGVCFITFDKISESSMMAGIIADKLGLSGAKSPADTVKDFLGEKKLLLVLDNLEHLLPGAGIFIADLLLAAPDIKIISTSRIPLEITAEQQLQLQPLNVPADDVKVELALQSDAVKLFTERIKNTKPDFVIDKKNLADVLAICRRLDGLPLALELAAARMRIFSPKQLAQKLNESLDVLKEGPRDLPDRQRTMRNVVAWSYELLTPRQKEVFYEISAFVGGVSYDAAEKVCNDDAGDLMDVLLSLAAQNLVRLKEEESSEIRFSMFDTIREFGLEKLKESGKQKEVQIKHALFYLDWVAAGRRDVERDPQHIIQLVQEELGNIRIALETFLRFHGEETIPGGAAASLGAEMVLFWDNFGLHEEARRWMYRALAPELSVPAPVKVRALWVTATVTALQGSFEEGEKLARESLEIAQSLNDPFLIANSQRTVAKMLAEENKYGEALELLDKCLEYHRKADEKVHIMHVLHAQGYIYVRQGKIREAKEAHLQELKLNQEEKNYFSLPTSYLSVGMVLEKEGNYQEAKKYCQLAIEQQKKLGDVRGAARAIHNLANIHFHEGEFAEAKRLYHESLVVKEKTGDNPGIATSLGNLGWVAFMEGQFDEAKHYHERSIAVKRKMKYTRGIAISMQGLALVTLYQGDYKAANSLLLEAIELAKHSEDRVLVAGILEVWSLLLEKQKHFSLATVLLGTADTIRKTANAPAFRNDKSRNDDLVIRLRKNLGETGFEDSFKTGRSLDYQAAIEMALKTGF